MGRIKGHFTDMYTIIWDDSDIPEETIDDFLNEMKSGIRNNKIVNCNYDEKYCNFNEKNGIFTYECHNGKKWLEYEITIPNKQIYSTVLSTLNLYIDLEAQQRIKEKEVTDEQDRKKKILENAKNGTIETEEGAKLYREFLKKEIKRYILNYFLEKDAVVFIFSVLFFGVSIAAFLSTIIFRPVITTTIVKVLKFAGAMSFGFGICLNLNDIKKTAKKIKIVIHKLKWLKEHYPSENDVTKKIAKTNGIVASKEKEESNVPRLEYVNEYQDPTINRISNLLALASKLNPSKYHKEGLELMEILSECLDIARSGNKQIRNDIEIERKLDQAENRINELLNPTGRNLTISEGEELLAKMQAAFGEESPSSQTPPAYTRKLVPEQNGQVAGGH